MKNSIKQRVFTSALPFVACLGLVATAQARVSIEPTITVDTAYDSNFWLSENDEVAVQTYSINPGVNLSYETGKTSIAASFLVETYWYDDLDDRPAGVADASDDNYVGFSGSFGGSTALTDRFTVGLNDRATYTRDPAQTDSLSNSTDREKYLLNEFSPNLYYDFGNKFAIGAEYSNLYIDYQDDGEDSVQNKGAFDFYYNLNSKAAVFLSYEVWAKDYDQNSSDYTSNRVKLNYKHQFSYFNINGGAGYHHRSFDQDLDSLNEFSWKVTVEGQDPSAKNAESRTHMSMSLGQDLNDSGAGDSYYTATRLEAEVGYVFIERVDTRLKGYYQNSDYDTYLGADSGREDDTYSISGLVGYKFLKNSMVSLEVGYKDRDSNITDKSYNDTFAMLSLDFGFELGSF